MLGGAGNERHQSRPWKLPTSLPLEMGGGALKSALAQVPGLEADWIGLGCSVGVRIFKSSHVILRAGQVLQPVIQW